MVKYHSWLFPAFISLLLSLQAFLSRTRINDNTDHSNSQNLSSSSCLKVLLPSLRVVIPYRLLLSLLPSFPPRLHVVSSSVLDMISLLPRLAHLPWVPLSFLFIPAMCIVTPIDYSLSQSPSSYLFRFVTPLGLEESPVVTANFPSHRPFICTLDIHPANS